MSTQNRPYESMKINVAELSDQLVQFHGGSFHESMYEQGHIEGVISYGPPGIGKTQSVMAAAQRIADENGYELVIYKPGVKPTPGKKQLLFVHMSMAGMTSGRIAGYPTTAENEVLESDSAEIKLGKQKRYVSRQVIPTIWRTAMEFPAAMYLFDEITHVVSQEAMLSLLSEGFYEETKLSQRALFVATANEGIADGTVQQKLSTAFRNRFTQYYIKGDVDIWRKQYANKIVHPACLAYASMYKERFQVFQMPDDNLLNTSTLRSLTRLSEDLQYFEMRNFRVPKKLDDGRVVLDPKGAFKDDIKISTEHETALMRLSYGLLGKEHFAQDFVSMYTLAYAQVIPQIKNVMNGKPVDDSFKRAIDVDDKSQVSFQKSLLEAKNRDDDKLKVAQDNIAKAYTYVDYLPRMVLEAWKNLPHHDKIKESGKTDPKSLRAYTKSLMKNFLDGVLLLPSNMRIMAIHHMIELCGAPDIFETSKKHFMDAEFNVDEATVPKIILFKVITENTDKPEYAKLEAAMKDVKDAKNVADGLKI